MVIIGEKDVVGVELLIDVPNEIVQFYALTSATNGSGRRIVDAVVSAIPLPTTLSDTALSLKREHEIGDTL